MIQKHQKLAVNYRISIPLNFHWCGPLILLCIANRTYYITHFTTHLHFTSPQHSSSCIQPTSPSPVYSMFQPSSLPSVLQFPPPPLQHSLPTLLPLNIPAPVSRSIPPFRPLHTTLPLSPHHPPHPSPPHHPPNTTTPPSILPVMPLLSLFSPD